MIKIGSGAYYSHFNPDEKTASLDFSGSFPFYPGDTQCYRNDSTVFLYVAHSYLSAYQEINECINQAFEKKQSKSVLHLIIPMFFLFRHYVELELKSLIMALTKDRADNTHNIGDLYDSVRELIENCIGPEDIVNEEEFEKSKNLAIMHLQFIEQGIKQYLQIEPFNEFYRYLYDRNIALSVTQVSFDYAKHEKQTSELISGFSRLEECLSFMIGFNYLMG